MRGPKAIGDHEAVEVEVRIKLDLAARLIAAAADSVRQHRLRSPSDYRILRRERQIGALLNQCRDAARVQVPIEVEVPTSPEAVPKVGKPDPSKKKR